MEEDKEEKGGSGEERPDARGEKTRTVSLGKLDGDTNIWESCTQAYLAKDSSRWDWKLVCRAQDRQDRDLCGR